MKFGRWAILLLFPALLVGPWPAQALDDVDVQQLATFTARQTYLKDDCNLVPSPRHRAKYQSKYVELFSGENFESSPAYKAYLEQITDFMMEYGRLRVDLPKAEFCARLKQEYEAAGGELVERVLKEN